MSCCLEVSAGAVSKEHQEGAELAQNAKKAAGKVPREVLRRV